jgi:hypothetical protein
MDEHSDYLASLRLNFIFKKLLSNNIQPKIKEVSEIFYFGFALKLHLEIDGSV